MAIFIILGVTILLFFHIQRIVFKYAERNVSKFMPIISLTALLIFGGVVHAINLADLRNKEVYSSEVSISIDISKALFEVFSIFILIAGASCVIGIVTEIIRNKGERRKSIAAKE